MEILSLKNTVSKSLKKKKTSLDRLNRVEMTGERMRGLENSSTAII